MSKTEHTPTPWEVARGKTGYLGGNQMVDAIGIDGVAAKRPYPVVVQLSPDLSEANAEFIVRAVNAHDALVAALALPLLFHSGGAWDEGKPKRWRVITGSDEATSKAMCDHIGAALRLARGEG